MKRHWMLCLLLGLCLLFLAAWADEARPLAEDPVVEQRVQRLFEELRCLVCQNQTLADSSAPLAEDLRREVREMAARGMSDKAIIDFLVTRYGDFVLYRPPLKPSTALLWLGPLLLLLGGGVTVYVLLRRRQQMRAEAPLSESEAQEVARILRKEP